MTPPPESKFEILEAPDFAKWVKKHRLRASVESLKDDIAANPDTGDVIPGGGGLRKIRMAGHGKGKRGGFRIIYVLLLSRTLAVLMDGYSKSDKEDLSEDELKSLVAVRGAVEAAITAARSTQQEGG